MPCAALRLLSRVIPLKRLAWSAVLHRVPLNSCRLLGGDKNVSFFFFLLNYPSPLPSSVFLSFVGLVTGGQDEIFENMLIAQHSVKKKKSAMKKPSDGIFQQVVISAYQRGLDSPKVLPDIICAIMVLKLHI